MFQLDDELERRKELGFNFVQVLRRQNELFINDEDEREKHQVNFMAVQREVTRILKEYAQSLSDSEDVDADIQNKYATFHVSLASWENLCYTAELNISVNSSVEI